MSKVFGIGWAKTGTTTLGRCFELLGLDHQGQHLGLMADVMRGDFRRVWNRASQKTAFEDWPWPLLYRELDERFPGSRFILTVRDPRRWIASYRGMLRAEGAPPPEIARIRSHLFGVDPGEASDAELIARFTRHNEDVLRHFRERPRDLLVVDWERGDGWPQLCAFLDVAPPNPAQPLPHLNRR